MASDPVLIGRRWVFPDGRTLPLVAGGADGDPPPADPPEPPPPASKPEDGLGDAGKKALDEERKARQAAEKAAKDAQAELEKLRQGQMTEQEKAVAQARTEGRQEALKQANERLVAAEVRAAAAGKLADPGDAIHLLDTTAFVGDDGAVDTKAITSAIEELVKTKPYLAATAGTPPPPVPPKVPGGPRGDGGQQLTRDDLKTMTPEEIVKAKAEGRLAHLLGQT